MFGWFKKPSDLDRGIFSFWDGADGFSHKNPNRRIDPLPLYDKVYAQRKEIVADLKAFDFPDTQWAPEARVRLTKTIRELFGVKPLVNGIDIPPGGSLKDAECIALLDDFLVYTERAKKKLTLGSPATPTSSQSTEGVPVPATGLPST